MYRLFKRRGDFIKGTDPSPSFRMTLFVLRYYDAFCSPLLVTCFSKIVILNGSKNALREKWETE